MSPLETLKRNPLAELIASACLLMASGAAYGVACPAPSGGQVLVSNMTVTATCTVPNLQSIQVDPTGTVAVTSYPDPGIKVANLIEINSITNFGVVQSTGNAVQVDGTVDIDITNNNVIEGTGSALGQTSEGIRLNNTSVVLGGIYNSSGASISAVNGNAIHLVGAEVGGGIHNDINAEMVSATVSANGYAALLIENGSSVHNGIVNAGHIGPSSLGAQNGSGVQVVGSTIYGNIDNLGTIDARGAYSAVQLDNSSV